MGEGTSNLIGKQSFELPPLLTILNVEFFKNSIGSMN